MAIADQFSALFLASFFSEDPDKIFFEHPEGPEAVFLLKKDEKNPEYDLNPKLIPILEKVLGLDFLPPSATKGNVCMAHAEEVLPAFRTTFSPIDLLNYFRAVAQNKKPLEASKAEGGITLGLPKDHEEFWEKLK